MKALRLLVVVLLSSLSPKAQTWQDTVTKIEKAFERYKPGSPGAQVTIARHGEILFSKAYGMADLEHQISLTMQSPTEAGSVSKQFTAAAILLLEQDGKLNLEDEVRKFIPELPDYGKKITLRHMMQHSSGLKDWGSVVAMTGWPRSTKTYNNDDALYVISKQKSLNHDPGAEYLYSNSNYNLFAIIVQRVSGQSLAAFTQKRIFEPAGMTRTEWRNDYRKVVPNRAIAYMKDGNSYLMDMPTEFVYGNGGLLTTTEDLVKWVHYYQSGKFGNPSLLPRQLAKTPFNNGRINNYTAGLMSTTYLGKQLINHDGATASYRSNLDYFPESGLTIAWLSNTSEFDNDRGMLISTLRSLFMPPLSGIMDSDPNYKQLTPSVLHRYTGWYENQRSHAGLKISLKENDLVAEGVGKINPVTDNRFVTNSNTQFHFSAKKYNELSVILNNGDTIYFSKRDSAVVNDKYLSEFAGIYYSDEAEAKVKIELKNNNLVLSQMSGKSPITLAPTFKDAFNAFGGYLVFERDRKGKVISASYSVSRARNVRFEKMN